MSDIRFNRWLHQSGTGGVYQASSGNVGIGTSVPSTTLDVNGSISATSISATSITATTGTITGNLSVGGVLTYDDVTNIDSVGVITARSDVSIADKIIHTGDTNTAIRFPAADTFTVETAATERLRIDSSGRVLISGGAALTSTSQPHPVQIAAASDASAVVIFGRASDDIGELSYFEADKTTRLGEIQYRQDHVNFRHRKGDIRFWTHPTGGTTERLRITSDGNIGIGYDSPTVKLHIREAASGVSAYDNRYHCIIEDDAEAYYGVYVPNTGYGGLRVIDGSGNVGSRLDYYVNENQMHYQCVGEHIFSTSNNTERLRITSNGSVDVTGKLRIDISNGGTAGSGAAEGIFLRNTQETDNNCVTIFGGADDYNTAASAINFINVDHSANAGDISFDTRSTSNSYAERLRITSGGYVNIGGDYTQTSRKVMINGGTVGQLEVKGAEADIWMTSTSPGNTQWRILGSTGTTTHRFRVYDHTNSRDCINVYNTGVVTMPQQCGFHVVMHANQSPNSGEMVTSWDTDASDSRSYIKNCTFNSGRFVAPVAGLYYFTSQLLLMNVASNDDSIHLSWTKGSSNNTFSYWNTRTDGQSANGYMGYGGYLPVTGSTTVYLAANEIFGIRIQFSGDIDVYGTDANWGHWSGFLVG